MGEEGGAIRLHPTKSSCALNAPPRRRGRGVQFWFGRLTDLSFLPRFAISNIPDPSKTTFLFVVKSNSMEELHIIRFEPQAPSFGDIEWSEIPLDWSREPTEQAPQFAFGIDKRSLWFCSRAAFEQKPSSINSSPHFVSGLWRGEVAELFIKGEGASYLEFHLATNKRWWAAAFSSYRVQIAELPDLEIEITTDDSESCWQSSLKLPLHEIEQFCECKTESLRAQVSFILGSSPQQFFSSGQPPQEKPDFHLDSLFLPLAPRR